MAQAGRDNVIVYWCEHNYLTPNSRGFPADGNLPLRDLFAMVRPKLEDPERNTCLFGYGEDSGYHDLNGDLDDVIGNWADQNFLFIFGPPGLTADDFDEERVRDELSRSMVAQLTFRLYANTSFKAMTIGFDLSGISLGDSYSKVSEKVTTLLRGKGELKNIIVGDQPCLFLPGGMPWPDTKDDIPYLRQWHTFTKMKMKLYAVFGGITPEMANDLPEVYGIENDDVKLAMRTLRGEKERQAMALLMMYCRMGGIEAEKLLSVLAKVTGFAPMIASFDKLVKGVNLRVFDLAVIVSSLVPLFSGLVTDSRGSRVCEHAIDLCGYLLEQFPEEVTPTLPLYEGRLDDSVDDHVHDFARAVVDPDEEGHIDPRDKDFVLWNGDFGDVDTDLATPERISLADLATAPKSEFSRVLESAGSTSHVHVPTFFSFSTRTCLYLSRASTASIFYFDPSYDTLQELDLGKLSTGLVKEEDLARDVGDIGKELIEQDMILCMDLSGSMAYRVNNAAPSKRTGGRSRRKIAEELVSKFLVNSEAFRVRQFVRIIEFSHECRFVGELTKVSTQGQVIEALQSMKYGRQTRLYDAVKLAAETLAKEGNPRQRITVFSDGKDEGSAITIDELFASVTAAHVVVDAICLTNDEKDENAFDYGLLSLVRATGGVFFVPDKTWDDDRVVSEGIAFMQQEAFVNLMKRKIDREDRKKSIAHLEREAKIAATNPEHEWRKCHNLEAEELEVIEKFGDRPMRFAKRLKRKETSRRSMRILMDADEITRNWSDDVLVQFCQIQDNPSVFAKFYFKLSEGRYSNRWWCLVAKCSPLYPTEPPVFRFGPKIPFHQNVSLDGLVVSRSVATEYTPRKSLLAQAREVMSLLVKPEDLAPVNMMWAGEDLHDAEIAKSVEGAMDEEAFRDFCVAQGFDFK